MNNIHENVNVEETEKNEQIVSSQVDTKSLLEEFGVLSHVEYGY
ncbi:hypothetical protein ACE41H_22475 [Paenibacillus enshidis]|uniref:Uncharacterized protein n=1 Tax=Paenibacillus enshidis TaxID=1458439 RepID=A0ABV5AZ71_9BACL